MATGYHISFVSAIVHHGKPFGRVFIYLPNICITLRMDAKQVRTCLVVERDKMTHIMNGVECQTEIDYHTPNGVNKRVTDYVVWAYGHFRGSKIRRLDGASLRPRHFPYQGGLNMFRTLIVCFIMAISVSAYGETGLKQVHPDEPAGYTFDERFSTKHSLESLAVIQSALESFRKLTEAAADKIPKERLTEMGNTGWEMQNLGFVNHVEAVKGTILKQDYLIKKLTYESAQRKSKSGEIDQKDLVKIKREYEHAEKQFLEFWGAFGIAD